MSATTTVISESCSRRVAMTLKGLMSVTYRRFFVLASADFLLDCCADSADQPALVEIVLEALLGGTFSITSKPSMIDLATGRATVEP